MGERRLFVGAIQCLPEAIRIGSDGRDDYPAI